ncbi:hypothetical protein [Candidatus Enterococcus ferrettii]|nr:hypothetical protein [Enterococcus sp. 665A]
MLIRKMNQLNNTKRKSLVLSYWLLLPFLFFMYLLTFATVKGSSVGSLLTNIPSLTLTFLLSCLLLIQAYLLYRLTTKETNEKLLNHFLLFSMLQQAITANLIGTVLLYLYRKSLKNEQLKNTCETAWSVQFETYTLMGLVGILSVLVVALTLIQ